jgi:serine/threonine-protein kinase
MRWPEAPETTDDPSLTSARELLTSLLSMAAEHGTLFGGYVVYEQLGRGGFGIVFRARRVGSDEPVALKQMRGGAQATPEERREFRAGAETAARLQHDGIVKILEVGEIDNCPFLTMPLVAGGNLAATLELGRPSQAQAARWLKSISSAIHHAHIAGVLHCDLKPANILLDAQGDALVADFGSARRLSKQGHCVESGEGVLSYYMAPEQASGDTRALTLRADIYSLGVILYELLTGQVPYEGLAFADWVAELVSRDPVRLPRQLDSSVNRDLELICLKCLEKDPSRRYASADLLADDLGLVLEGQHPSVRPEGLLLRALRWARLRPMQAAIAAGLVLFGFVLALSVFSVTHAEQSQQRGALETNALIASSQAGALLFQLREFADRAERCGQKPSIRGLLINAAVGEGASELESCARGFQSVYLTSANGRLLTQWPHPPNAILGRNYAFRDYFLGSRYLGEHGLHAAFLGQAYRAESNGQLQFAVSAPVFDSEGKWIGCVVAALAADSAIGQVRLQGSLESGRSVALLGPRGNDRPIPGVPAPAKNFDFVVHPRLGLGREVAIQEPVHSLLDRAFGAAVTPGEQFSLRWEPPLLLSDYRDPLLDPTRGSLAAFAPVGQTGYIVVVQTSKDAVRRDVRALATQLAWRAGVPLAAGLALLGWAAFSTVRRKRSLETRPRGRGRSQ